MADLKKKLKRSMRSKMTSKTMELLIGLNEKNHRELYCLTEKFSNKLLNAYLDALKKQNKQAEKERNKKQKAITAGSPVAYIESAPVASQDHKTKIIK